MAAVVAAEVVAVATTGTAGIVAEVVAAAAGVVAVAAAEVVAAAVSAAASKLATYPRWHSWVQAYIVVLLQVLLMLVVALLSQHSPS